MTGPSQKTSATQTTTAGPDYRWCDTRPQHSPYAEDVCELYFRNGNRLQPLRIHRPFLKKSPKLASECSSSFYGGTSLRNLELDNISLETGHVVVHFLTTGEYSCLRPAGKSESERNGSEFATALRVCAAAKYLELPTLQSLAASEIWNLGRQVELLTVIRTVADVSPDLVEGATYVASRVQDFCRLSTHVAVAAALDEAALPKTVGEVLFESIARMRLQQLERCSVEDMPEAMSGSTGDGDVVAGTGYQRGRKVNIHPSKRNTETDETNYQLPIPTNHLKRRGNKQLRAAATRRLYVTHPAYHDNANSVLTWPDSSDLDKTMPTSTGSCPSPSLKSLPRQSDDTLPLG